MLSWTSTRIWTCSERLRLSFGRKIFPRRFEILYSSDKLYSGAGVGQIEAVVDAGTLVTNTQAQARQLLQAFNT
jgi:hypothetical protein